MMLIMLKSLLMMLMMMIMTMMVFGHGDMARKMTNYRLFYTPLSFSEGLKDIQNYVPEN